MIRRKMGQSRRTAIVRRDLNRPLRYGQTHLVKRTWCSPSKQLLNANKTAKEKANDDSHKSVFDVAKGSPMKQTTFGGVAAEKTKKKKEGGDGESGNKVRNLSITKLVENLNIYNQNGTTMSKESIRQMVQEALLTASADFTLGE